MNIKKHIIDKLDTTTGASMPNGCIITICDRCHTIIAHHLHYCKFCAGKETYKFNIKWSELLIKEDNHYNDEQKTALSFFMWEIVIKQLYPEMYSASSSYGSKRRKLTKNEIKLFRLSREFVKNHLKQNR